MWASSSTATVTATALASHCKHALKRIWGDAWVLVGHSSPCCRVTSTAIMGQLGYVPAWLCWPRKADQRLERGSWFSMRHCQTYPLPVLVHSPPHHHYCSVPPACALFHPPPHSTPCMALPALAILGYPLEGSLPTNVPAAHIHRGCFVNAIKQTLPPAIWTMPVPGQHRIGPLCNSSSNDDDQVNQTWWIRAYIYVQP